MRELRVNQNLNWLKRTSPPVKLPMREIPEKRGNNMWIIDVIGFLKSLNSETQLRYNTLSKNAHKCTWHN